MEISALVTADLLGNCFRFIPWPRHKTSVIFLLRGKFNLNHIYVERSVARERRKSPHNVRLGNVLLLIMTRAKTEATNYVKITTPTESSRTG